MNIKIPDEFTLREYQEDGITGAIDLIESNAEHWHLLSAPTGSGKSLVELGIMERLSGGMLVTPRIEIIAGILDKLGYFVDDMKLDDLIKLAFSHSITTPIRLRNILAKGELRKRPRYVIFDEGHHAIADTNKDIEMYLNGVAIVLLTATPFRGTPKGTRELLDRSGDIVHQITTIRDCVAQGTIMFPEASIWPLVDDDIIDLTNGEFKVSQADELINDRLSALVDRIKWFYDKSERMWDRPTMFSMPSTESTRDLLQAMAIAGLPAFTVTQATTHAERQHAFREVLSCRRALVQIDVVSEGVDLRIERLIDLRPTMSPVKWCQQVGRIMRPNINPPEYICCCRNLERHAYIMEGMFPDSKIKEAVDAFATPFKPVSKRMGTRVLGLEGLGKFTNTAVELMNGINVLTYNLVHVSEFKRTEYYVMVHPNWLEPVIGQKVSNINSADNSISWGKWNLIQSMPDLKGCQSLKISDFMSDPQKNKWAQMAAMKGLNPEQPLTNRKLQTLFFLLNTGKKL